MNRFIILVKNKLHEINSNNSTYVTFRYLYHDWIEETGINSIINQIPTCNINTNLQVIIYQKFTGYNKMKWIICKNIITLKFSQFHFQTNFNSSLNTTSKYLYLISYINVVLHHKKQPLFPRAQHQSLPYCWNWTPKTSLINSHPENRRSLPPSFL